MSLAAGLVKGGESSKAWLEHTSHERDRLVGDSGLRLRACRVPLSVEAALLRAMAQCHTVNGQVHAGMRKEGTV